MTESINQRVNALLAKTDAYQLRSLLVSVLTDLQSIQTQFNQLRTEVNGHTHGGVTTGAGTTSAMTATTSTAVTLNTTS